MPGPDAPLPEPNEIRAWIDLVINLATRLVDAFDRAFIVGLCVMLAMPPCGLLAYVIVYR